MSLTQHLRRKLSFSWLAVEKSLTMLADQLSRQIEGLRADYKLKEHERKLGFHFEKTGSLFYSEHRRGSSPGELSTQADVSQALSEYKRLDMEIKLLEQKKFLMHEEDAAAYWAEFADIVTRSGMMLERFTLPVSFLPAQLKDLAVPDTVQIISVLRNKIILKVSGNTELQPGDQMFVMGPISQIVLLMQRYSINSKNDR